MRGALTTYAVVKAPRVSLALPDPPPQCPPVASAGARGARYAPSETTKLFTRSTASARRSSASGRANPVNVARPR
jgi:hypothetical protein